MYPIQRSKWTVTVRFLLIYCSELQNFYTPHLWRPQHQTTTYGVSFHFTPQKQRSSKDFFLSTKMVRQNDYFRFFISQ